MRIFAAMGIALLLAGCAAGGGRLNDRERYDRVMGSPVANPSAIVQAELAFARLAQEEGQWTAFRETATDDAIMFTPDLVNAQQWLKGKADPLPRSGSSRISASADRTRKRSGNGCSMMAMRWTARSQSRTMWKPTLPLAKRKYRRSPCRLV